MISQPAILERVIEPQRGNMSPELARYILKLGFPPADQARYLELSEKAQKGNLSLDEGRELDDYLNVNAFLTIVQSKARVSLKRNGGTP